MKTMRVKTDVYSLLDSQNALAPQKDDIYSNPNYANLYGDKFEFCYEKGDDFFKVIAIKSPIDNSPYFDISTPYGYGGFTYSGDKEFFRESLAKLNEKAMLENIIAFFVRFHPFDPYLKLYSEVFPFFSNNRKIVVVDTQKPIYGIRQTYSQKTKYSVKRARNMLKINPIASSEINQIYALYTQAMQKLQAAEDFYFFDVNYFKNLLSFKETIALKAIYDDRLVGFASFFLCGEFSYYHLSASTGEMEANAALLDFFFEYAHQNNSKFCILGGGLQNEDGLYFFKQKFSNLECSFFIGGLVFNQAIFDNLCKNYNNNRFLKYRP